MEFLRRVPQWLRDAGNGALDVELDPGVVFRLEEVRLHLDAPGGVGAGNFSMVLDSGVGAEHDMVLINEDMEAETDFVFGPIGDQRVLFDEGDKLVFAWPNTNGVQYGLEVIWSRVRDGD